MRGRHLLWSRTIRLIAVACGAMLLDACTSEDAAAMTESGDPPAAPPPALDSPCDSPATGTTTALGAQLSATLSPAADGLGIVYEVTNNGASPVYVVNLIADPAFTKQYGPGNYYVMAGADGVVEIAKREYYPPDSCVLAPMAVPPAPALAVRLEPGQKVGAELRVPYPLAIRTSYGTSFIEDRLTPLPESPDKARFCVGVAATAIPRPGPPATDATPYFMLDKRAEQAFLCSAVTDLTQR